jgi:hypothetical protein
MKRRNNGSGIKTSNSNLQTKLDQWAQAVKGAVIHPHPSPARSSAIANFCRSFVPSDVTEDDISYFTNTLVTDEEFFQSMVRELSQCASGENVEKIEGDQLSRAMYTIKPQEGTISEASTLDIVREVAFISSDGGMTWTAEG